jgi:hypothetical protein
MQHRADVNQISPDRPLWRDRDVTFILAVALAVRIAAILPVHAGGYTSDEREYIAMSRTLAEGGEFIDSNGERSTRAPLFPYVLSTVARLFGPTLIVPHLLGCLLGALSVMLVYQLSIHIWAARQPALIAAAATAIYPGLVIYSTLLQTEILYIVFVLTTLLAVYRWADEGGIMSAVLIGIAAGCAALTRAVFFGFIPLLFLLGWALRRNAERKVVDICLAVAACLIVLLPWSIRNYSIYHAIVPVSTGGGNSLLNGNNPFATGTWRVEEGFDEWYRQQAGEHGVVDITRLNEVERSSLSGTIAGEYITHHPWETIQRALTKAHIFLVYPIAHTDSDTPVQLMAVGADVILLMGVGLGLAVLPSTRGKMLLLGIAILFFFLVQVILHAEARFRLPLIPFLCLFFGWGGKVVAGRGGLKEILVQGRARRMVVTFSVAVGLVYGWTTWLFIKGSI